MCGTSYLACGGKSTRRSGEIYASRGYGYWRRADSELTERELEEVRRDTEPGGGVGAATPAVCEPRPNFCRVRASSLPVGFKPCEAWNLRMASEVESSHLPFGSPAKEPSLARAD